MKFLIVAFASFAFTLPIVEAAFLQQTGEPKKGTKKEGGKKDGEEKGGEKGEGEKKGKPECPDEELQEYIDKLKTELDGMEANDDNFLPKTQELEAARTECEDQVAAEKLEKANAAVEDEWSEGDIQQTGLLKKIKSHDEPKKEAKKGGGKKGGEKGGEKGEGKKKGKPKCPDEELQKEIDALKTEVNDMESNDDNFLAKTQELEAARTKCEDKVAAEKLEKANAAVEDSWTEGDIQQTGLLKKVKSHAEPEEAEEDGDAKDGKKKKKKKGKCPAADKLNKELKEMESNDDNFLPTVIKMKGELIACKEAKAAAAREEANAETEEAWTEGDMQQVGLVKKH